MTSLVSKLKDPMLRWLLNRAAWDEKTPMPKRLRPECGYRLSRKYTCSRPVEWDHEANAPAKRCMEHTHWRDRRKLSRYSCAR